MVYKNGRRNLYKGTHRASSGAESTTPLTRPTTGVTQRSLPVGCCVSPCPCACILPICLLSPWHIVLLFFRICRCGYPYKSASQEGLRYVAEDSVSGRESTRSDPIRGWDIMHRGPRLAW